MGHAAAAMTAPMVPNLSKDMCSILFTVALTAPLYHEP